MTSSRLIFIVGPTAVGKSEIALLLAKKIGAEIVSCDAMQVYKEVTIASDKPSARALAEVPHHCLGIASVTEDFDVSRFRQHAVAAIADVQSRGRLPLIVGGSGMYVSILLDGIFEGGVKNEALRLQLAADIEVEGAIAVHAKLQALDPVAAAKIHVNDPQRIIRALEVVMTTGKPISQLQQQRDGLWGKQPIILIGLEREREELYRRVEARIDVMFERGLVEEVRHLMQMPLSSTAAKVIGIPEVSGHLRGEYDIERAKYLMKLNTRHYVKRQLTWFKRDQRIQWFNPESSETIKEILEMVQ